MSSPLPRLDLRVYNSDASVYLTWDSVFDWRERRSDTYEVQIRDLNVWEDPELSVPVEYFSTDKTWLSVQGLRNDDDYAFAVVSVTTGISSRENVAKPSEGLALYRPQCLCGMSMQELNDTRCWDCYAKEKPVEQLILDLPFDYAHRLQRCTELRLLMKELPNNEYTRCEANPVRLR